jgi:hypothetical protein
MGSPKLASTDDEGRSRALLPNPFLIHEANETNVDPTGPLTLSSPSKRSVLDNYPAPDFASGFLPQPIPILEYDGEPEFSSPLEALAPNAKAEDTATHGIELRGIKLFSVVFSELSKQLGKEFSTAELMRAAQQLIDLSKDDFVGVIHKDRGERAGYYSWDLVRAFISHPWQIAGVETNRIDHCDIDEYPPESFENAKLLLQGWNERTWEF